MLLPNNTFCSLFYYHPRDCIESEVYCSCVSTGDTYKGHLQSDRLVLPLVVGYVTTREVDNTVKILKEMTARSTVDSDWTGQFIVNVIMFRKVATEPDQLCSLLKVKLYLSTFLFIYLFIKRCEHIQDNPNYNFIYVYKTACLV